MTWKVYKVVFRMESPLHSGWMKIGNIQRTRLYITGSTLWGAISARITRILGNNNYIDVGDKVKNYLRTTYFYPCFDVSGNQPLIPFYESNGLAYRIDSINIPANVIERALLTSYLSTAMDTSRIGAEEGSLHEIELLSHKLVCPVQVEGITINSGSNVYLVGYIFESHEIPPDIKNNWLAALKEIQIGGERAYGFGHLFLENFSDHVPNIFNYNLVCDHDEPIIKLTAGKPILAHTIIDENLQGVTEPFVCRGTDRKTGKFGVNHLIKICWSPGSIHNEDKIYKITEFGLWEALS